MKFEFSKGITGKQKDKIRYLFNLVKTRACKDLLIRVHFLKEHSFTRLDGTIETYFKHRRYHGYYKNINAHGFYDSEWDRIYMKKSCSHIIQLSLSPNESEESMVGVMAHEFKHYLQYKKGVKKRQHIEPDAEKFAKKVANKLIGLRLIAPDNNGLGAKYPALRVWDACEYIFNLKGGLKL